MWVGKVHWTKNVSFNKTMDGTFGVVCIGHIGNGIGVRITSPIFWHGLVIQRQSGVSENSWFRPIILHEEILWSSRAVNRVLDRILISKGRKEGVFWRIYSLVKDDIKDDTTYTKAIPVGGSLSAKIRVWSNVERN